MATDTKPVPEGLRRYRIREGGAFVQHDGTRLTGGAEIDLPPDVAALHAQWLDPVHTSALLSGSPEASPSED